MSAIGLLVLAGQAAPRVSVMPPRTADSWAVVDLPIRVDGRFENPFDPDDIRVDVHVTSPRGKSSRIPAFFSIPYEFQLADGRETARPLGDGAWRARVLFTDPGINIVQVSVRNRDGRADTGSFPIEVSPAAAEGFVRVSNLDRRYFATDSGTSYYPVGVNLAWPGLRGVFDYDEWLTSMGKAGANLARVFMAGSTPAMGIGGAGRNPTPFDQAAAARMDWALNAAKRNGMRVQICLDSPEFLQADTWPQSPLNIANGGPLRNWSEFWASAEMERQYRNRLRYIVGRFGADPTVFAWEIWNDGDTVADFDIGRATAWHKRAIDYLKSTDAYGHLVTTSYRDSLGVREIDLLPQVDFVQSHVVGVDDLALRVARLQTRKAMDGKPHFVGDVRADTESPRTDRDPGGFQVHDPIWASVGTGASGTAMPWWWDSYLAPQGLARLFGPVARFTEGIDFPREQFRQQSPMVEFRQRPRIAAYDDLTIPSGPVGHRESDYNRPRRVTINAAGRVGGDGALAGILHGVRNPKIQNPMRFSVKFPRPVTLRISVTGVEPDGAGLTVTINGHRVLTRAYGASEGDASPAVQHRFDGDILIPVPAGAGEIAISNPGAAGVLLNFAFTQAVRRVQPQLDAFATVGNTRVLGWVRRKGRTWSAVTTRGRRFPVSDPATLRLKGLARGTWTVELWDTWTGRIVSTRRIPVSIAGNIATPIPAISGDLAIKMSLTN